MKSLLAKYHLDIGLMVAVVLPVLFSFQETLPQRMLIRSVSSGMYILSLWTVNFILVDFTKQLNQSNRITWYVKLVLAFVLTTGSYIIIGFLIDNTGTMLSQVRGEKFTSGKSWFYLIVRLSLLNVLVLTIKYLFDSTKEKRQIELENAFLRRENMAALNEVLKQQLRPHFLFNSLNTLKSLVRHDSALAVDFIDELSSVYRYMLLHQTKEVVALKEEIEFAKSYLMLLSIRFGDSITSEISVPNEFLTASIPPNTLQLLIENAVKHNALSQDRPLHISLCVKDSFLIVWNNIRAKAETEGSSNIGLKNIETRYKLLFKKDILIQKTEARFQVSLPLSVTNENIYH
jgi:sensor histidine kinase YesM